MENFREETEDDAEDRFKYHHKKDKLGEGDFSEVFRAKDKLNKNQIVALKIIDRSKKDNENDQVKEEFRAELLKSFKREVELIQKCQSEYSVNFYDAFQTEDSYYLVTEFCTTDLKKYIYKNEKLSIDKIRDLFKKINIALEKLQIKNVIHRDLKPQNILINIDEKGSLTPKLCDYGSAREMFRGYASSLIVGTPCYKAPELLAQMNGKNEDNIQAIKNIKGFYNGEIDLWSIGVILYEVYNKKCLFTARNVDEYNELLKKFDEEEKNKKIKVPESPELEDLLKKLIEKDPYKRIGYKEYFNHSFWGKNEKKLSLQEYNQKYKKDYKINTEILKIYFNNNTIEEEISDLKNIKFDFLEKLMIDVSLVTNCNEKLKWISGWELDELKLFWITSECKLSNIDILSQVSLKNLKEIDLIYNNISDIKILSKINFYNLEKLNLHNNKITNIEILKDSLFSKLKELVLSCNHISDIKILSQVAFKDLKNLNLSGNQISDIDILNEVPFKNLENLQLDSNKISNIQILSQVEFKNLILLELDNNQISEEDKSKKFSFNVKF